MLEAPNSQGAACKLLRIDDVIAAGKSKMPPGRPGRGGGFGGMGGGYGGHMDMEYIRHKFTVLKALSGSDLFSSYDTLP